MEEIHFLVDEINEKLDKEIESVLFQIQNPEAKRKLTILNTFTRALIKASNPDKKQNIQVIKTPAIKQAKDLHSFKRDLAFNKDTFYTRTIPKSPQIKEEIIPSPKKIIIPPQIDEKKIVLIKESQTNAPIVKAEIEKGFYTVYEPELTVENIKLLNELLDDLENELKLLQNKPKLYKKIIKTAKKLEIPFKEDESELKKIRYYLIRNILTQGAIEPLFHDEHVHKIICEGPQKPIIIFRNGKKLTTNLMYSSQQEINIFLQRVAKSTYQELSDENPFVDASYKGYRVKGSLGSELVPSQFIIIKE